VKIHFEHTDTFGGEANYSWVNRLTIEVSDNKPLTRRQLVRRAKKFADMSRYRADVSDFGDMISIQPKALCQIVFITFEY
jgi:hypothetical protein